MRQPCSGSPYPEGGERGVCADCGAGRHSDEPYGHSDEQ